MAVGTELFGRGEMLAGPVETGSGRIYAREKDGAGLGGPRLFVENTHSDRPLTTMLIDRAKATEVVDLAVEHARKGIHGSGVTYLLERAGYRAS